MFKYNLFRKLLVLCLPVWLLALPNAPTDLVLIPSKDSVKISWNDNSNDETGFKIYRDDKIVGYTQSGVETYVDSGLEENRLYKYTIKATDDTISTSLTSGVEVFGIADKDNYKYYTIAASAGDTVTVNLHDMDADGDLYVNIAKGASISSYTCKSKNSGEDDDSCTVTLGSDETVYIAVYAAKCINNVQHNITATITDKNNNIYTSLTSGVDVFGIADKYNYSYYKIDASAGDTVTVNLSNMDADGDLYVNIGESAYKDRFTCRSIRSGRDDDSCSVTLGYDTTVYVSVYANKCINNVQHNIVATITNENAVQYGVLGDKIVNVNNQNDYTIYSPTGVQNAPIVVFISGWNQKISNYSALMTFIASHGYYVIGFDDPYKSNNSEAVLITLLENSNADTSKVSILGHSSGGGLVFCYLKYIKDRGYAQASSSVIELDGFYATDMHPNDMKNLDTTALIIRYGGLSGIELDNNKILRSPKVDLAIFTMLEGTEKALLTIEANNKHSYQDGPVADDNFINNKQDLLRPVHAFLDYTLKGDQNAQSIAMHDNSADLINYLNNAPEDNELTYNEPCEASYGRYNYCDLNHILSDGEY